MFKNMIIVQCHVWTIQWVRLNFPFKLLEVLMQFGFVIMEKRAFLFVNHFLQSGLLLILKIQHMYSKTFLVVNTGVDDRLGRITTISFKNGSISSYFTKELQTSFINQVQKFFCLSSCFTKISNCLKPALLMIPNGFLANVRFLVME